MNASPATSLKHSKSPRTFWTALPLGLALAVLPYWNASAQIATDKIHGYGISGTAMYTASGTGHTGHAGDAAMDMGTTGVTLLTVTDPAFFSALNAATANDTLSVSLWAKLYSISGASGFFFYSPSSSDHERGFQAHLPWSDDTIYFDTAGCCDGGAQRISKNINTLPAWIAVGDDTWWTSWHHFVFLKNGSDKQVWIDGVLFLEGQNTGPLPTDFNLVSVGSGIPLGVAGSLHGQIDDFAIYGTGLSSNQVQQLAAGTAPDALTGATPLAYWDFNPPPKPTFSAIQAGPNATVTPDISAYYVIANGSTAVQLNTIQLGINNSNVTAQATIVPQAVVPVFSGSTAGATIYYSSPTVFAPGTTQTVSLAYSDNASHVISNSWQVVIEGVNGYVTDVVKNRLGFLEGSAVFSLDKGGHTGKAGDRAIDLWGVGSGGDVHVGTANFLNQGATNGTLSVSVWMKYRHINNGAAVWARSPTAGGQRGYAGQPWSDENIYFDTAGCCDQTSQRISASITAMPNYVDSTFWNAWHNYVFVFNMGGKEIWVDGVQIGSGSNTSPLPTDFSDLFFGWDTASSYSQALIDDVSVFATPLSATSIASLTNGVLPTALAGETVLAYWNFDTVSPGPPFISLASTPAPGSTNSLPNVGANIIIVNRDTQVLTNTIIVKLDTNDVTSLSIITSNSAGANITFLSPTILPALSTHRLSVVFSDNSSPPSVVSNSWTFAIGPYGGYTRDARHGYLGMFVGNTSFSSVGGGHSGGAADRSLDLGTAGNGGATVTDAPFLNALSATAGADTLSVSFWLKQSSVPGNSAFWVYATSASGSARDFQAHVPNGDANRTIYFDTAGCCNPPQRISAGIGTFAGYTGTDAWWAPWHHFVFEKNGINKQIFIDGQLFLDQSAAGVDAAPLATDIYELLIGAGNGVASPVGQIDDFAVYGDPLSAAQVTQLATGTSPLSVSGVTNLVAYWSFDDVPPAFVKSISPAANATGVTATGPAGHVVAVLYDGSTQVNKSSVRLTFNGADVTSQTVISNTASGVTRLDYAYPLLASGSTNKVTLVFNDNATPPNLVSNSWSFVAEVYTGATRDVLHNYVGLIQASGQFTANGGGSSGQPGDYAMDFGKSGGPVHIEDATFLYPAETNNTMTFSFWAKNYDLASASAFWVTSPSSSGTSRGFQAHLPYGDTIYFDTSGCCDGGLYRISQAVNSTTVPAYFDGWWTNWHQFVFEFNAGDKQIWIDGLMFFEGNNSAPLALDFTDMFLGRDVGDGFNMHGAMDDFAAFATPVTPANIALLAQGTLPTALAGEKLLAYWNFNDVPAAASISITRTSNNLVISYVGTLQSSTNVTGTYTDMTGAPNPYTTTATGQKMFYRARQ
jgi:hypothetical protein